MGTIHRQCAYCGKYTADFNKEHVIPRSLGNFDGSNLTLIDTVCADCNNTFAKGIEISAARDSLLLAHRLKQGLTSNNSLKHSRKHAKIVINLPNEGEVEVRVHSESGLSSVRRPDSLIVYNSTKGNRVILTQLNRAHCYKSRLDAIGLYPKRGYIDIYANFYELLDENPHLTQDELVKQKIAYFNWLFAICNIDMQIKPEEIRTNKSDHTYNVHVISESSSELYRLVAKIAFNYFLFYHHESRYISLFSAIKNFILLGYGASDLIVSFPNACLVNTPNPSEKYHALFLFQNKDNDLFVALSLFNDGIFIVKLANNYPASLPAKVQVFSLDTKQIYDYYVDVALMNDALLLVSKLFK